MSLNSKKICFSLVLAAAAGMVQAVNSSCLLADAGFVAVQDNTVSAGNYTSNRPRETTTFPFHFRGERDCPCTDAFEEPQAFLDVCQLFSKYAGYYCALPQGQRWKA